MNHPIVPWCLHWGRDGELAQSDRQDVFQSLSFKHNGLARLMLTQAMQGSDPAGPSAMPKDACFGS